MRRRKLVAANARRRFKISALCIGGQFLAAISEAAYCGDPGLRHYRSQGNEHMKRWVFRRLQKTGTSGDGAAERSRCNER